MRWVAHIDMDAFFASVEQLTRPTLRDRPVLVGGLGGRGVVAGASYEARAFGARSAMPMGQAVRLCNNRAVVIRPRKEVYAAASRRIFQVIRAHAGVVEQLSVDEGFAEPQGLDSAEEARDWAENLQARVEEETGLPASVGMAATKLDAKMASDLAKPHGVFVVQPEARMEVFADRPVGDVWGIGKVAQGKLHTMGIDTIGQFVAADTTDVRGALGSVGVESRRAGGGLETERGLASAGEFVEQLDARLAGAQCPAATETGASQLGAAARTSVDEGNPAGWYPAAHYDRQLGSTLRAPGLQFLGDSRGNVAGAHGSQHQAVYGAYLGTHVCVLPPLVLLSQRLNELTVIPRKGADDGHVQPRYL